MNPDHVSDAPATEVCAGCGATFVGGATCAERQAELLALEYSSPTRMRVHHLSVVTFQAQHAGSLTDAAVAAYDAALVRFAASADADPWGDALRGWLHDQLGAIFEGATRVGADVATARARPPWSRTIADVELGDDETYVTTVIAWARATGDDLAASHGPRGA